MKDLLNGVWKNSIVLEKILYIYVVLLPFIDLGYLNFGAKRVGWIDIVFLGIFIIWTIRYMEGRIGLKKIFLEFPIVLMLVLFSMSVFNSKSLFDSFTEMSGLIYLIILFYLIPTIIINRQKLLNLLGIVFITGTAVALAGIVIFSIALITGKALNNPFLHYTPIESLAHCFPRLKFMFESPNMMLSYLHFVLIVGIILFLLEKNKKRMLFIAIGIAILLVGSVLTGSRSFVGLFLSLFIIQLLFGRGKMVSFFRYITIAGFIFFLLASLINSIWVVFPIEIRKNSDGKFIELKACCSYSTHFIRPVASMNMFKKHPLIGVGFGTYKKNFGDNIDWNWFRQAFDFNAYPQYLPLVENKTLSFDPHSLFLGTFAETGLIGFFGLVYFLISYMALLTKRFKDSYNYSIQNIICGCILAGFIGFLLNGLILDILSMRHFWLMMAIGVASYE